MVSHTGSCQQFFDNWVFNSFLPPYLSRPFYLLY
nr:MAG TPA: hypothetical protein [Caudoviricetes sp.]